MKQLEETLALVLLLAAGLALCFLFWGEPDVWDRLHERAMSRDECRATAGKETKW